MVVAVHTSCREAVDLLLSENADRGGYVDINFALNSIDRLLQLLHEVFRWP